MKKTARRLLMSSSVILMCVCVIAGMTYALFTDSVSVNNHLEAGDLEVKLERTNLKYNELTADGLLEDRENDTVVDFTNVTDENIFGLDYINGKIVPGSYFEATMRISNAGNVAFTYGVKIELNAEATELAKQLQITVKGTGGTETAMLSELADGMILPVNAPQVLVGDDTAQTFTVRVEFVDDTTYNSANGFNFSDEGYIVNNNAENGTAAFDLIVYATQATN